MRKIGIIFFMVSVVAIAIFPNCSEVPLELTDNIIDPESGGVVKDTTLFAIEDTTYLINSEVGTESSARLLIGRYEGFEARPIIRFTDYSSIPDSADIQDAKIYMISVTYHHRIR